MSDSPLIPGVRPINVGTSAVGTQSAQAAQQSLPAGTQLSGVVSGHDEQGNAIIRTEALKLVLNTQFAMAKGSQVVIRLEQPLTRNQQPSVQIVSVAGKPTVPTAAPQSRDALLSAPPLPVMKEGIPAQLRTELAKPVGILLEVANAKPEAAPVATPRGAAATQVNLSDGTRMTALLFRPAPAAQGLPLEQALLQPQAEGATPLTVAQLKTGLQLQIRILQVILPSATPASAAGTSPAAPTQTAPTPEQATPAAPSIQARNAYAAYTRQSVGGEATPVEQRPVASSPASQPVLGGRQVQQMLQQAEAPLGSGQMAGVVTGKDNTSAPIVQTNLGSFSLPQVPAGTAPPGTILTWDVQGVMPPQQPGTTAPQTALPLPEGARGAISQLSTQWNALSELVQLMQNIEGTPIEMALSKGLSNLHGNFTAGLVQFMSILRKGGDIGKWLGKDVQEQLELLGKTELLGRLNHDMGMLSRLFNEPQTNWQGLLFPVMHENQPQQVHLFIKKDEENKKGGGGSGTRFVVELDLTNLGPMQLDGLVKKREQQTYFDLVIRTHDALATSMENDIQAIYARAQEGAGFTGNIYFRTEPVFSINPLEEIQRQLPGDSSIMA